MNRLTSSNSRNITRRCGMRSAAALYTVGISEEDAGSSDISNLDPGLRTALRQIAPGKHPRWLRLRRTLSPIVANPSEAPPHRKRCQFFATSRACRTPPWRSSPDVLSVTSRP